MQGRRTVVAKFGSRRVSVAAKEALSEHGTALEVLRRCKDRAEGSVAHSTRDCGRSAYAETRPMHKRRLIARREMGRRSTALLASETATVLILSYAEDAYIDPSLEFRPN